MTTAGAILKPHRRYSYPELYDVERDWQEYYSSYVSTYLERDIHELISADGLTFAKFKEQELCSCYSHIAQVH